MTYQEIMNRLRLSKKKVARLSREIEAERTKQENLLTELGTDISSVTGETIRIGKVVAKKANPDYNRDEISDRIVQLREQENKSFAAIAVILNTEGFKPRTAKAFSQATIYQLYNGARHRTALAAVAS
jgi:septal ring factor EnvC (AmiA/AmiB activator)